MNVLQILKICINVFDKSAVLYKQKKRDINLYISLFTIKTNINVL